MQSIAIIYKKGIQNIPININNIFLITQREDVFNRIFSNVDIRFFALNKFIKLYFLFNGKKYYFYEKYSSLSLLLDKIIMENKKYFTFNPMEIVSNNCLYMEHLLDEISNEYDIESLYNEHQTYLINIMKDKYTNSGWKIEIEDIEFLTKLIFFRKLEKGEIMTMMNKEELQNSIDYYIKTKIEPDYIKKQNEYKKTDEKYMVNLNGNIMPISKLSLHNMNLIAKNHILTLSVIVDQDNIKKKKILDIDYLFNILNTTEDMPVIFM
jgi:hypothetical protein